MNSRVIIFGATGYTGQLTAKAMVKRGLRPLLAGRNEKCLKKLSKSLGDLPFVLADVTKPLSLETKVTEGDVLVSTVGPFSLYGKTAIETAIKKRAIYIDSTGEHDFIRKVFEVYHLQAVESQVPLLTAFGYDYVPGNCLASSLIDRIGKEVLNIEIGYFVTATGIDRKALSDGTLLSLLRTSLEPGITWTNGAVLEEYVAQHFKKFQIGDTLNSSFSICGSEHFTLPKIYPQIMNIKTYLGWFGAFSYLFTMLSKLNLLLFKVPGFKSLRQRLSANVLHSKKNGPDAERRASTGSHIIAYAYDVNGHELAKSELIGVNGYTFTANILAWAADQARQGNINGVGALGPVEAFGLKKLQSGCEESGLKLVIS